MADDGDGDYRRSEDYRRRASAAVLRATEDPSAISSLPQRLRFYTMSAVYILALKGVRAAVPHLVPAMAADLGFDSCCLRPLCPCVGTRLLVASRSRLTYRFLRAYGENC